MLESAPFIKTHSLSTESSKAEALSAGLSRRQTLKWMGVVAAGVTLPMLSGCEDVAISAVKMAGHWPDLKLPKITGEGYGQDPNLISPLTSPWPLTMSKKQLHLAAQVCDILYPRDGDTPSASELKVPDLLDEWVSAPYPNNQADRQELLPALVWLDEESGRRFGKSFTDISKTKQFSIVDDIAYKEAESDPRYLYMANVFDGLRTLVTIAYFASPEGTKDLGYIGNIPIAGDYPGPTPEAIAHLDTILDELGLTEYAYS